MWWVVSASSKLRLPSRGKRGMKGYEGVGEGGWGNGEGMKVVYSPGQSR